MYDLDIGLSKIYLYLGWGKVELLSFDLVALCSMECTSLTDWIRSLEVQEEVLISGLQDTRSHIRADDPQSCLGKNLLHLDVKRSHKHLDSLCVVSKKEVW